METASSGAARSGGFAIARVVMLIGSVVAGVIVLGILLIIFDANPRNDIVEWITDAARWLAGPFHNLFTIEQRNWRIAVNWGLAAVVYLAVSRFIASLLTR